MTTYSIQGPDGKTYSIDGPPGASREDVIARVQASPEYKANTSGSAVRAPAKSPVSASGLPSIMDRLIASPVGRFAQENIVAPAMGVASLVPGVDPVGQLGDVARLAGFNAPQSAVQVGREAEQSAYRNALARNRNTPGYGAAKSVAEKAFPQTGPTDMPTSPFNESLAALAALPKGLDASNAAADVVANRTAAYQQEHPVLSTILGTLGGLSATPEGALASAPKTVASTITPAMPATRAEGQAAKYVSRLASSAGKTPTDIAQYGTEAAGKPVIAGEALGRPGVTALSALGRRSGTTPDALEGMLTARSAEAPDRILGDMAKSVGIDPYAAQGNIEGLISQGRQAAKPLYDAAYEAPMPVTQELRDLAARPSVKQAMNTAVKMIQDAGGDPVDYGFMRVGEGPVPDTGFSPTDNGYLPKQPTTEAWDLVKRAVDGRVQSNLDKITGRPINPALNHSLQSLSGDLKGILRKNNPQYASAMDMAGDYLSAQKAYQDGQKYIFNPNRTEKQIGDAFAKMSPAEQEAFKGGIANRMFDMARNNRLKPSMLSIPRVQSKLAAVFGQENTAKLSKSLQTEAEMQKYANRMKPGVGSPTAELDAMMGEQNTPLTLRNAGHTAAMMANLAHGNIPSAVWRGGTILGDVRDTLFNPRLAAMSVPVRDEVGRMLMMKPEDLAAYLNRSTVANAQPFLHAPSASGALPLGLLPQAAGTVSQ